MGLKTPLLFIIFNRPEQTAEVFEIIRKYQPEKLFVSGDGPRNEQEIKLCNETRSIIKIDWPCEIKTLYRDHNLGCKKAVSSAIDWFFDNIETGIILEDDCLPNESFFPFCTELLEKYKNEERIMHIGGNFFQKHQVGLNSYYFSKIPHIWGWATWRRAWKLYDVDMKHLPEFKKDKVIKRIFDKPIEQQKWLDFFENIYYGHGNTWDFQWTFTIFNNNGLCINPNKNLVTNIGFGNNATHSFGNSKFSNAKTNNIDFPLIHPSAIEANISADHFTNANNFGIKWSIIIIKYFLKKLKIFNLVKNIRRKI